MGSFLLPKHTKHNMCWSREGDLLLLYSGGYSADTLHLNGHFLVTLKHTHTYIHNTTLYTYEVRAHMPSHISHYSAHEMPLAMYTLQYNDRLPMYSSAFLLLLECCDCCWWIIVIVGCRVSIRGLSSRGGGCCRCSRLRRINQTNRQ